MTMIEWELDVDSISQEHGWMVLTFTNNKRVTMKIEEWKKIDRPAKGDTIVMTVRRER